MEEFFLGEAFRLYCRAFPLLCKGHGRDREVVPVLPRNDPRGKPHLHHPGGSRPPAHIAYLHYPRRRFRRVRVGLPAYIARHAQPGLAHRAGPEHRRERGTYPHRKARVYRRTRPLRDVHPRLREPRDELQRGVGGQDLAHRHPANPGLHPLPAYIRGLYRDVRGIREPRAGRAHHDYRGRVPLLAPAAQDPDYGVLVHRLPYRGDAAHIPDALCTACKKPEAA